MPHRGKLSMSNQYSFPEFIDWCKHRGLNPNLPHYFDALMDDALYKSSDISLLTGLAKESINRWFRNRKLLNQSASNAYKAYGRDYKQFLFNRPVVLNPLKNDINFWGFFNKN